MPKQPAAAAPVDTSEEMTLEEFCQRRSQKDRRVELLAAFHGEQVRTNQIKATEKTFSDRLDSFANQPV